MKIAWVDDFNCLEHGGGTAYNDRRLAYEGIRRGHELVFVTPQSPLTEDVDAVIFHNIFFFDRKVIEKLAEKPYVFHSHDYIFCKWRLWFPAEEKCRKCAKWWEKFVNEAKLCVFLSPLHLKTWQKVMDVEGECIPSAINPAPWLRARVKVHEVEKNSYLAANPYSFKGLDNLLDFQARNPGKYYWVGSTDQPDRLRGWTYLGFRKYDELPELFASKETFVHLPPRPSPFDRTVAEAIMAGMKVVTNKNAGITSYRWWNNRTRLAQKVAHAHHEFWDAVEEVLPWP